MLINTKALMKCFKSVIYSQFVYWWIQNGGYQINRRQDSNLADHLAIEN